MDVTATLLSISAVLVAQRAYLLLIAPLQVKRVHTTPIAAHIEEVDLLGEPFAMRQDILDTVAVLGQIGFGPPLYLRLRHGDHTQQIAYLVDRGQGDSATVSVVQHAAGYAVPNTFLIEFSRDFEGGVEVSTNTMEMPNVFRPDPRSVKNSFPGETDVRALYALHGQLALRHRPPGAAASLPPAGGEVAHLKAGIERSRQRQAQMGLLRLDRRTGVYRPTLWGAYEMSWKLLFPFRQIRMLLVHRRAAALRRSLTARPPDWQQSYPLAAWSRWRRQQLAQIEASLGKK